MYLISVGIFTLIVGFTVVFIGALKQRDDHDLEMSKKVNPRTSCTINTINIVTSEMKADFYDDLENFEFKPNPDVRIIKFNCAAYNKDKREGY